MDIHRRVNTGRYAAILSLAFVACSLVLAAPVQAQEGTPRLLKDNSPACARALAFATANPSGEHARDARKFIAKHCNVPAPVAAPQILSVTSDAPCSATITGTSLAAFDYINMDFDALILTPIGYQSFLRVYQPGNPLNFATTTVTVTDVSGATTIRITNPATCGQNMIVTSMLFGGTTGTAWYSLVHILP